MESPAGRGSGYPGLMLCPSSLLPAVMLFLSADSGGVWSPLKAAQYLDNRQKEWLTYKPASAPGGTCASCHGALLYALARPALRSALGEGTAPNEFEKEIVNGLRSRLAKPEDGSMFKDKEDPGLSQGRAIEAILAAYLLPGDDQALQRMVSLQLTDGPDRGAWKWFDLKLEPWEGPQSRFFGAALAALALNNASRSARSRPDLATSLRQVSDYLLRNESSQPLHNRVMLLWSQQVASKDLRKEIVAAIWQRQLPDGSWSNEALGPWSKPVKAGSNDYATALIAYSLGQSKLVSRRDPRLEKALSWLSSRQDPAKGNWSAQSMNKDRKPESMPGQFMNDAATAFATMALLSAKSR